MYHLSNGGFALAVVVHDEQAVAEVGGEEGGAGEGGCVAQGAPGLRIPEGGASG